MAVVRWRRERRGVVRAKTRRFPFALITAAVACGLLVGCNSTQKPLEVPSFMIHGTVRDSATHVPLAGVAVAIGSTLDTLWEGITTTVADGEWSYGSLGTLVHLRARFAKTGYDTIVVSLEGVATYERLDGDTSWYRYDPNLIRAAPAGPR